MVWSEAARVGVAVALQPWRQPSPAAPRLGKLVPRFTAVPAAAACEDVSKPARALAQGPLSPLLRAWYLPHGLAQILPYLIRTPVCALLPVPSATRAHSNAHAQKALGVASQPRCIAAAPSRAMLLMYLVSYIYAFTRRLLAQRRGRLPVAGPGSLAASVDVAPRDPLLCWGSC